MWIFKLTLTTVWMAGTIWTLHGLWHLLAAAVVALELIKGTRYERRLIESAAAIAHRLGAHSTSARVHHA